MEHDCADGDDWYQWSMNRAAQCDVFVGLCTRRVGSKTPFGNILNAEYVSAGGVIRVLYELERPFNDADRLYLPAERDEYEQSLVESENDSQDSSGRRWDLVEAQKQRFLRLPTKVQSVNDLVLALERDLKLSAWEFATHRMKRWRFQYFDTTSAGRKRAIEDEKLEESSSRTAVLKCLRKSLLLLATAVFLGIVLLLHTRTACYVTAAVLFAVPAVAFATAPTYLWIGSKTVVARGFFGLITTQQSRLESLQIASSWYWLKRWCDVDAVAVRFASGRWVFVPFIRNAGELVSASLRPPSKKWEPAGPKDPPMKPGEFEAKIRAFIEQLEHEEE